MSIHNDLHTWAGRARRNGHDTIYITPEIAEKAADLIVNQATQIENMLIGGNHLANVLIGKLGASFSEVWPFDMDHEDALRTLCATDEYEVWCCWSAMMRAREALSDEEKP